MGGWTLYIGTYSQVQTAIGVSRGIYCGRLDGRTGALELLGGADDAFNPSYLALAGDLLFAANELEHEARISAYRVEGETLRFLNQGTFPGGWLCNVNHSGGLLFGANYGAGSALSVRVGPDGVGALAMHVIHLGSSVDPVRQTKPYVHCAMPDRQGRCLLVCDLGTDRVMRYAIGPDGTLRLRGETVVPPGEGPRHLAFDRTGARAFLVTEMGCSVLRYDYEAEAGLIQRQILHTLQDTAGHTGADIALSPDERFLFASVRDIGCQGRDFVARFRFDGEALTPDGRIPVKSIPRGIGLSPDGRLLIVCCQDANRVQVFEAERGELLSETAIPAPACVKLSIS